MDGLRLIVSTLTLLAIAAGSGLTNVDVASSGLAIPDPLLVTEMRMRLLYVPDASLAKNGGRQTARYFPRIEAIEFVVVAKEFDDSRSIRLPIRDGRFNKWLRPSPGIESDSMAIKSQAAKIVGNEVSAYRAAGKIRQWVNRNIRYSRAAEPNPDSALSVLESRQGVCGHLAILETALARAAGIPAQVVVGPVYTERNGRRGFQLHAWTECYVGEWVPFDPSLATDFVDATHVKLFEGGAETVSVEADLPGSLRAQIMDFKSPAAGLVAGQAAHLILANGNNCVVKKANGKTVLFPTWKAAKEPKPTPGSIVVKSATGNRITLPPGSKLDPKGTPEQQYLKRYRGGVVIVFPNKTMWYHPQARVEIIKTQAKTKPH